MSRRQDTPSPQWTKDLRTLIDKIKGKIKRERTMTTSSKVRLTMSHEKK